MKKSDKPQVVESLTKQLKEAKSAAVINYQGLPNSALGELREKIRQVGGNFVVAKNTLIKRSMDEIGLQSDEVDEGLTGPTAIVFANEDEIAPLQLLGKSIKETEFPKLKFGIFNNVQVSAAQLLTLSNLPSKNVLQARLLASLIGPKHALVGVLNGNIQKLVYILDQRNQRLSN